MSAKKNKQLGTSLQGWPTKASCLIASPMWLNTASTLLGLAFRGHLSDNKSLLAAKYPNTGNLPVRRPVKANYPSTNLLSISILQDGDSLTGGPAKACLSFSKSLLAAKNEGSLTGRPIRASDLITGLC